MTTTTVSRPDELRPVVRGELEDLDPVELDAVHRLILRLRMDRSLDRLNELADDARGRGALDRLPAILAEVRARRWPAG